MYPGTAADYRFGYDNCECINAKVSFSASPTSGAAPLTVNFYPNFYTPLDVSTEPPGQYAINFGDGSTSGPIQPGLIPGVSHTYTASGEYSASLIYDLFCAGRGVCLTPVQLLGTVKITVGTNYNGFISL